MIKLAIIQRRIAPFRIPFFERLNESGDLDLTVFYADSYNKSRLNFHTQKFNMKMISIGSLKFNISYGLLIPLLTQGFKVYIFEGAIYNIGFFAYVPILKLFNKKICWWSCGWEPFGTGKTKSFIRKLLYGIMSHLVDNIIVYSTKAKKYYESLRKKSSQIYIAWNVLDNNVLMKAKKNIRLNDMKHIFEKFNLKAKKVILFVGKIESSKKLGLLIQAYQIMLCNNWRNKVALLIIGDGMEKTKWESYAVRERLSNIHFVGEIRDPIEIANFFKISNIFVMPGAGGLAIYHVMLYGLPVIVSSADGTEIDLVIDNETGFFFKPDDYHDLAEKISAALNQDSNYLKKVGLCARNRALQQFPIEKMLENFREAVLA